MWLKIKRLKPLNVSSYWRAIIWQASGNSIAQFIAVLGMPVLTRLYLPQDFALQSIFLQFIAVLSCIITFRYEYFIQLPKNNRHALALANFVFIIACFNVLVFSSILFCFKDEVALLVNNQNFSFWILFVPLGSGLVCVSTLVQHYVQRNERYRLSASSEIASKFSLIFLGVILSGIRVCAGLIISSLLSLLIKILFLVFNFPYKINHRFQVNKNLFHKSLFLQARKYSKHAFGMTFSSLLTALSTIVVSIFVSRTYGSFSLGQFALVNTTIYLPSGLIGSAIGQVYYQKVAEHYSKGLSIKFTWTDTIIKLILFGLPIYLLVAILSPILYPLIFGRDWILSGEMALFMSAPAFFSFVSSPVDRTCFVLGRWWWPPLWHSLRIITTFLVLYCSISSRDIIYFIKLLSLQMSLMYLIDFFAQRVFINSSAQHNLQVYSK